MTGYSAHPRLNDRASKPRSAGLGLGLVGLTVIGVGRKGRERGRVAADRSEGPPARGSRSGGRCIRLLAGGRCRFLTTDRSSSTRDKGQVIRPRGRGLALPSEQSHTCSAPHRPRAKEPENDHHRARGGALRRRALPRRGRPRSMPGGAPCCPGSGRSLSLWLQATHRASASSCLYLPVSRYACRRRPAASGRILPAAWLGVLASVA